MRISLLRASLAVFGCILIGVPARAAEPAPVSPPIQPQAAEFFERRVRPILADHCQSCHGPKKQMAGLRLDSRAAAIRGGDRGAAVKPGDPDASLLIQAVRQTGDVKKMPPKGQLPPGAVETLTAWVKMGAPWPEVAAGTTDANTRQHWAFQPVRRPPVPAVSPAGADWTKTEIDKFILARLEQRGLAPSPAANRSTLVRRAFFDLIGLPPTPEELENALSDNSPDWYEKLIDRLLASPHYGERWGRYWLDVARYADTKGYVIIFEESEFHWAYTYRDYVIRALNEDLPYDRFILEQLAADRLEPVRPPSAAASDKRHLAAMGFLTLGNRFVGNPHDVIDDRIDVVSRGLMGLTVSCARCHDHKFDPIPSRDYYSLYGVFASSPEPVVPPLFTDPPRTPEYVAFEKELQAREQRLVDFVRTTHARVVHTACLRTGEYLQAAHALRDSPDVEEFMFVADAGDLNPRIVHRWQVHLERTRKQPDPVFGPWHAFAALPEKDFATRSAAVLDQLRAPAKPLNPLVVEAILRKPPTTMAELAKSYGDLFRNTEHLWQETLAIADELGESAPTALPDPAREQLRLVLRGPDAPPVLPLTPFGDLDLFVDRGSQGVHQKLRKALDEWRVKGPGAPPRALTLEDAPVPFEPYVFLRGNPSNRGPKVPRQLPSLLSVSATPQAAFKNGSGRLEFAQAIASKDNPLTARVMVNRIWMHHFGSPLVATPGDFGTRSGPPTHPELLDWLASEFMASGGREPLVVASSLTAGSRPPLAWSIKKMHRLIMLSNVYRQASADRPEGKQLDPDNALLWKMNLRRLDFEALRDSLLAVGGTLDRTVGGPPVRDILSAGARRRTLYGYIDRERVPGLYRTFDFPSPDATSPRRDSTTVAPQALFLMNHPFVAAAARRLVQRPDIATAKDPAAKVSRLYRILYGRDATTNELNLAREFLAEAGGQAAAWERYAQALLLANEFAFID